ncbi:Protein UBASH3A [Nymphon striatum]|nr:Protein UBASH3A [Nymphon striatum]
MESMSDEKFRQLFVIRHGERVDFTFKNWISECFDSTGKYTPTDLNQPNSVPARKPEEYFLDCPLTKVGHLQAYSVGKYAVFVVFKLKFASCEAISEKKIQLAHVFCSPSLRCVQTCHEILRGAGLENFSINIEPGLFEWLQWLKQGLPHWLNAEELSKLGFKINQNYKPIVSIDSMKTCQETCDEYYNRNFSAVQHALNSTEKADNLNFDKTCAIALSMEMAAKHSCEMRQEVEIGRISKIERESGNVLVVAHASSLDTCTRQLIGKAPREATMMTKMLSFIPYCSVVKCVQSLQTKKWSLESSPFNCFTNTKNFTSDSRYLFKCSEK